MPVCKFYLNGACRYGDKCWFIHPEERLSSKGDYYVSTNQRSLWKPSSPPIGQKNYGSSGVAFSFNNALSSSNRNAGTKKSLFSINRFDAVSDDEDMEHGYDSRYSSSAPSGNFRQQHSSAFSLSHIAKSTVAPQHVGLFKPKSATNDTPALVTTFQTDAVAPQHVGLFKPKFANATPGLVATSQTGAVPSQHVGLFQPKSSNDKPNLVPTSQKPIQFSFAPNQFKVINNISTIKEQQNLFKQASFNINHSVPQSPPSSQPKTLFGKPVGAGQVTGLRNETIISRSSISNSILSESHWLEELGLDTYSKLDELTPYEKDCFTANVFELRNVPLRPPPKELCF